jgi:hypothetical protein
VDLAVAAVYVRCISHSGDDPIWRVSMARIRGQTRALCTLGSALLILSGCDRLSHGDADFARAALERNPDLTIVASDKDANTFTVQVKGSSELRVIRADEVIGILPSTGAPATVADNEAAKASPSSDSAPAAGTDEPSSQTVNAGDAARPAGEADARSASAASSGLKSGSGFVTDASGKTRTFGGADNEAPSTTGIPSDTAASPEKPAPDKKVLATGPGYTVTAGEQRTNRAIRLAEATELKSPSNAVVEQRYDPMICQGNRLIQINGRKIRFEGDGLSALDGCELHITNSHIIAHGLGLSVRAANVHIQNSIIEGDSGSVSASSGAKVYSQQSTFKGLSRRLDTATFEDLGGTNWN